MTNAKTHANGFRLFIIRRIISVSVETRLPPLRPVTCAWQLSYESTNKLLDTVTISILYITVTAHERNGVSNHIDCLFDSLFRQTKEESIGPLYWHLWYIPALWASTAENVSIIWNHHKLHIFSNLTTLGFWRHGKSARSAVTRRWKLSDGDGGDRICETLQWQRRVPDSKVHGANMESIWGRHDPGGPHVGPMNFVIWGVTTITGV